MVVAASLLAACSPAPSPAPAAPTAQASTDALPTDRPSASPAPTDVAIEISLTGAAPAAILLDGDRAWVLAGEGGTLIEVDLRVRRELRSIQVGFGATHLVMADPNVMAVARFDDSGSGSYLVLVDLVTEEVTGIETRALGGLAAAQDGAVWVLEKADRLLLVDTRSRAVLDDVVVDIGENVHLEVQWGEGAAWVGSDGGPLFRVGGEPPVVQTSITVPSGIPFLVEGGLVWGAGPTALWALDPATNNVVRQVALEGVDEILGVDIDGDEAWLAVRRAGRVGRVLQLDLSTGRVMVEHSVALPAAVRIAPDHAWVASYLDNTLVGFAR